MLESNIAAFKVDEILLGVGSDSSTIGGMLWISSLWRCLFHTVVGQMTSSRLVLSGKFLRLYTNPLTAEISLLGIFSASNFLEALTKL